MVATSWLPSAVPMVMRLLFQYGTPIETSNRVDVSHRVLNIPYYFAHHYESEMAVDIRHCSQALELLHELVNRERLPVNYVVEVRGCGRWVGGILLFLIDYLRQGVSHPNT